jgi:hypothetical protein
MSLIAVGDRVAKIAWYSQPRSDEGQIDWHTSDIAKLSGLSGTRRRSASRCRRCCSPAPDEVIE